MYLSSLIEEAYRKDGVVVAYIYGPMGYGKTSYALWTAYEVYGSWDKVMDYLYFSLSDAIDLMLKYVEKGRRIKLLILDDAGFYINKLTWWEKDKVRFMELINLARTITAGIVFTSPSAELPRQILSKSNYRISVRPLELEEIKTSKHAQESLEVARKYKLEEGGIAIAKGYQLITLPSFFKIVRKEFIDYYPLWYPIYEEYQKIRFRYVKMKLKEIKESMKDAHREELFETALELYKKTQDMRKVYEFLKRKKIPQSTAHRWAFHRIPKIVKVSYDEGS